MRPAAAHILVLAGWQEAWCDRNLDVSRRGHLPVALGDGGPCLAGTRTIERAGRVQACAGRMVNSRAPLTHARHGAGGLSAAAPVGDGARHARSARLQSPRMAARAL